MCHFPKDPTTTCPLSSPPCLLPQFESLSYGNYHLPFASAVSPPQKLTLHIFLLVVGTHLQWWCTDLSHTRPTFYPHFFTQSSQGLPISVYILDHGLVAGCFCSIEMGHCLLRKISTVRIHLQVKSTLTLRVPVSYPDLSRVIEPPTTLCNLDLRAS